MKNKNLSLKENILKSARELFLDKGYEKTSMRDIAKKAKVSLGSVVYHYNSKDNLMYEVSEGLLKELRESEYDEKILVSSSLERLFLYQLLLQVGFNQNPKIERFFNQLLARSEIKVAPYSYTVKIYRDVLKEFSIDASEDDIFKYMQIAKFVEIGFTRMKLSRDITISYLDSIYLIIESSILPLGISKETLIDAYNAALGKLSDKDIEILKTDRMKLV